MKNQRIPLRCCKLFYDSHMKTRVSGTDNMPPGIPAPPAAHEA
jgi:hypothetical protein